MGNEEESGKGEESNSGSKLLVIDYGLSRHLIMPPHI